MGVLDPHKEVSFSYFVLNGRCLISPTPPGSTMMGTHAGSPGGEPLPLCPKHMMPYFAVPYHLNSQGLGAMGKLFFHIAIWIQRLMGVLDPRKEVSFSYFVLNR